MVWISRFLAILLSQHNAACYLIPVNTAMLENLSQTWMQHNEGNRSKKRVIRVEIVGEANTHQGLCITWKQYGSTSNNIPKMTKGNLGNPAVAGPKSIGDKWTETGGKTGPFCWCTAGSQLSFCEKIPVTGKPKSSLNQQIPVKYLCYSQKMGQSLGQEILYACMKTLGKTFLLPMS